MPRQKAKTKGFQKICRNSLHDSWGHVDGDPKNLVVFCIYVWCKCNFGCNWIDFNFSNE